MAISQFPLKKTVNPEEDLPTGILEDVPVENNDLPPQNDIAQADATIDELMVGENEDFSLDLFEPNPNSQVGFSQDNRRFQRYLMRWQAILLSPSSKSVILQSVTQDISKGGASVLSDQNILLKSKLPAIMQLIIPPFRVGDSTKVIEIPCYMVHVYLDSTYQQFRIGIEFSDMDHTTQVILNAALAEHTPSLL